MLHMREQCHSFGAPMQIVQSLYFLNPKFQVSILLWPSGWFVSDLAENQEYRFSLYEYSNNFCLKHKSCVLFRRGLPPPIGNLNQGLSKRGSNDTFTNTFYGKCIMVTYPCNLNPLASHFDIEKKLGLTWVYIFLFSFCSER